MNQQYLSLLINPDTSDAPIFGLLAPAIALGAIHHPDRLHKSVVLLSKFRPILTSSINKLNERNLIVLPIEGQNGIVSIDIGLIGE